MKLGKLLIWFGMIIGGKILSFVHHFPGRVLEYSVLKRCYFSLKVTNLRKVCLIFQRMILFFFFIIIILHSSEIFITIGCF